MKNGDKVQYYVPGNGTGSEGYWYPAIFIGDHPKFPNTAILMSTTSDGALFKQEKEFVRLPPKKMKGYVNIYPTSAPHYSAAVTSAWIYTTEREANKNAGSTRIACVPIEWEEAQ